VRESKIVELDRREQVHPKNSKFSLSLFGYMRTDNIFYQLFQTLSEVLFELIGEPVNKSYQYIFTSVEVKELSRSIEGLQLK